MAYSPKSQKEYNDNCTVVKLKYSRTDQAECDRMKKYTKENNIPMSVYIKQLIKQDLDNKGIPYVEKKEEK